MGEGERHAGAVADATGGGGGVKRFFFGMTKIKEVKNWYCSLEMKEQFGMRPPAVAS